MPLMRAFPTSTGTHEWSRVWSEHATAAGAPTQPKERCRMKSQLPHREASNQPCTRLGRQLLGFDRRRYSGCGGRKMVQGRKRPVRPDWLNREELFSTSLSYMSSVTDGNNTSVTCMNNCYRIKARMSSSNALQMGKPRLSRVRRAL